MTAVQYRETHGLEYVGKHSKKTYKVWRMIYPTGPIVVSEVQGYDKVLELCSNCYYYEISEVKNFSSYINI